MICPQCEGDGFFWIGHGGNEKESPCSKCWGTGDIEEEDYVES